MALSTTNFETGPARIWLGCAVPASGARLQLATGLPTSGVEIGVTEGAATIMAKANNVPIKVEQASAAVDYLVDADDIQVTFTAKEVVVSLLKKYLSNASFTAGITDAGAMGTVDEITFGGKQDIVTPVSVALVWERRGANRGKYGVFQIYKVNPMDGISIDIARGKEMSQKVTLAGMTDLTRAAGDQIAKMYVQQ